MLVTIQNARSVGGTITAPPSKSMAHRAVLCAALAEGRSHITNLEFSKDISATLGAAAQLCARVRTGADDAVVEGLGHFVPLAAPVDCCESGSTLRFLIPIASLTGQAVSFTGRADRGRGTDPRRIPPCRQCIQPVHQRAAVCSAAAFRQQHAAPHPAGGEPQLHRYDPLCAGSLRCAEPLAGRKHSCHPGRAALSPLRLHRGGRLQSGRVPGGAGGRVRRRDHHRPCPGDAAGRCRHSGHPAPVRRGVYPHGRGHLF